MDKKISLNILNDHSDQSLRYIVIKYITIFTFLISLVFFFFDINSELNNYTSKKQQFLDSVNTVYVPPATIGMWYLDQDLLDVITTALLSNELVRSVKVINSDNSLFKEAVTKNEDKKGLEFIKIDLLKESSNGSIKVGVLEIGISDDAFRDYIEKKILTMLFFRILKTMALALFIFIILNILVIKPLENTIEFQLEDDKEIPKNIRLSKELRMLVNSIRKLKIKNNEQLDYILKIQSKLDKYNKNLLNEQEQVRKDISLFLHDSLGQQLSALKLKLQMQKEDSRYVDSVTNIIKDVKELSYEILPGPLACNNFKDSVQWMIDNTLKTINIEIKFSDECNKLELVTQVNLYRIIQEFIHNSLKYMERPQIYIEIVYLGKEAVYEFYYIAEGENKYSIEDNEHIGLGKISLENRIGYINGEIINTVHSDNIFARRFSFTDKIVMTF